MVPDAATLTCFDQDDTLFPVRLTLEGDPYDITGHTLSWIITARQAYTPKLQIDVSDHGDPVNGESSLTLTAANIVTIGGPGNYTLTGIDVDPEGNEVTRVVAKLTVYKRVARTVGS